MTQQTINVGTVANDGTGDPLRTAFTKANSNFTELYAGAGGVLSKSGASASHTGDATETVLATITIPANTVGSNGVIKVTSFWTVTNSANVKNIRHRLGGIGGTVISSVAPTALTNLRVDGVTFAANATNSQNTITFSARGTDGLVTTSTDATSAIDMTASTTLVITGQLVTTSETITLLGYIVEINP